MKIDCTELTEYKFKFVMLVIKKITFYLIFQLVIIHFRAVIRKLRLVRCIRNLFNYYYVSFSV